MKLLLQHTNAKSLYLYDNKSLTGNKSKAVGLRKVKRSFGMADAVVGKTFGYECRVAAHLCPEQTKTS
jgi:hypothetical protein